MTTVHELDKEKISAFMADLKKLTVAYGIVLESCECGGGFEPILAPNHVLEDPDWGYVKTPIEWGGHYQYANKETFVDDTAPGLGEPFISRGHSLPNID